MVVDFDPAEHPRAAGGTFVAKGSDPAPQIDLPAELPSLAGTPKQRLWAESIRAETFAYLDEWDAKIALLHAASEPTDDLAAIAAGARILLASKTQASWWIDRRNSFVSRIFTALTARRKPEPLSGGAAYTHRYGHVPPGRFGVLSSLLNLLHEPTLTP